jgi:6-phosphogluconolactonase
MNTVVFVANADSGSVSVLTLNTATGALQTRQELVLGGQVMPLAVSPDRRHLYAARRSAPLAVVHMAIDGASGQLSVCSEAALPASMAHIALDASGRWLLTASYHDGLVAVCKLAPGGTVQPPHQVLPTGPKTHSLRSVAPGEALACVLGEDAVICFALDADRGHLTPQQRIAMPAGSGPRHLAVAPDGQRAFVVGELDGSVSVLERSGTGWALQHTVSALAPGFTGTPWAADLRLAAQHGFLYASERTSSTLALLRMGADGRLTVGGHWPAPAMPRGFAISPCERWLVCAGQMADAVAVYRVDADSGRLEKVGEQAVGRNPNWVEMIELA